MENLKKSFEQIKAYLQKLTTQVGEGDREALSVWLYLRDLEKRMKANISQIAEQSLDEAEKHGKGVHIKDGFSFSTKASGGKWKYEHLTDWANAKANIKKIEDKYKLAYKAFDNNLSTVNVEDGEITALPEYTSGKDSINFGGTADIV